MRAVIQRVSEGSVSVAGEVVGSVGEGMVVLLGVGQNDGDPEVEWMVRKIAQLRFFEGPDGRMNQSVEDTGGGVLLISQFTLFGNCKKGNRPSFSRAGEPGMATERFEQVATGLRARGIRTETGTFGATMRVSLVNEGPVTLLLDSEE